MIEKLSETYTPKIGDKLVVLSANSVLEVGELKNRYYYLVIRKFRYSNPTPTELCLVFLNHPGNPIFYSSYTLEEWFSRYNIFKVNDYV